MANNHDYLFNEGYLSDFLNGRREEMRTEIDNYGSDYLLKVGLDDVVEHLADKYSVEPVVLSDQVEIAESGETEIDVSGDRRRAILDRSQPHYVKAAYATFVIPFEGDPQVFRYRPSQGSSIIPAAHIVGDEVRIRL